MHPSDFMRELRTRNAPREVTLSLDDWLTLAEVVDRFSLRADSVRGQYIVLGPYFVFPWSETADYSGERFFG